MKHSVEDYVTVMVESEQDAFEETGFASFPSQETDEFQDLKSHLMSFYGENFAISHKKTLRMAW